MFGRRTRETITTYRHTFGQRENRQVFRWIVAQCGIFKPIANEEQRIMHNWGIALLENMGMTQGVNYERLCDFLLDQTTIPEEAIDK